MTTWLDDERLNHLKLFFSLPESGIAQSKVWGTVQDEVANLHRQQGHLIFEKKSEQVIKYTEVLNCKCKYTATSSHIDNFYIYAFYVYFRSM